MPLFQKGMFSLFSGRSAEWKVDCSALSEEDWECVANLILERCPNFSFVECATDRSSVLRDLLSTHATSGDILLVDDVLDIELMQMKRLWYRTRMDYHNTEILGYVVFACLPCPTWVRALWQLDVRTNVWEAPTGPFNV